MRLVEFSVLAALLALSSAPTAHAVGLAQSGEKPAAVVPKPKSNGPTVANFQNSNPGAPVELFPNEDIGAESLDAAAFRTASVLKSIGFKRNPIYVSNDLGYAVYNLDVVATLERQEAVHGYANHVVAWDGALWSFEGQETLDKFMLDPAKYVPPYGGHCAYCMAINDITSGYVVQVYKGRLYLFVGEPAKKKWAQQPEDYIALADRLWPSIEISRLEPIEIQDDGFLASLKKYQDQLASPQ